MSHRGLIRQQADVSLFPFLAVLICTMGALIVLLVVVVQQAKQAGTAADPTTPPQAAAEFADSGALPAATEAEVQVPVPAEGGGTGQAEDAPPAEDGGAEAFARLQRELEDLEWHNSVLLESRQRTHWRLEEQRRDLGRHEEQSHQLETQLDQLEKQAQAILATEEGSLSADQASQEAALAELRGKIEQATGELDRLREQTQANQRRYSLVPYEGPQGTKRRPIYVECLADRVLLQPSGIELVADDFWDTGPGNPLAAAMRATREYLRGAGIQHDAGEPYPLLIVRPGGAQAYSACRNALQGWGDEFGYELIAEEMELAYPPSDASLTERLRQTVELARLELAARRQLAALSEGPAGGLPLEALLKPRNVGQVAPTDHLPTGGPSPGDGFGGQTGDGRAAGGAGKAETASGQTGYPSPPDAISGPGRPGRDGWEEASAGSNARGGPAGKNAARATGQMAGDGGFGGVGGPHSLPENEHDGPAGQGRSPDSRPETPPARSGHWSAGASAPGELGPGGEGSAARGGQGLASGPAAAGGSATAASGGAGRSSFAGAAGPAVGALPSSPTGISLGGDELGTPEHARSHLARSQGDNWALPRAAVGAIGVTRPIRVTCGRDRITLLPERGARQAPRTIAMDGSVQAAVQPLVTAVWEMIEGWGIAGPGVYWKPVLQVRVDAAADQTYTELARLLQGSGLELQRR